ncbi:MAG: hypothetical protein LBH86_04630 [Oscillospiraceae bacterium]|jgi:ABC-2 type transport system permease protein|nr:hypothetical protein [Oscillospiraceae bacterium]
MKKSLFSGGLYLDVLRQLRLVGGIMLAVVLLFTILLPVVSALSHSWRDTPDILALTPALAPFMYLGTVVLVFAAFSFLFSRRASDFYHALPETRLSLYGATAGAALTWVLGTVALAALTAHAVYGICGYGPVLSDLLPNLLGYASGSLLVAGCALVGVCAAGTRFSAFILTVLLLWLPRYLGVMLNVTMDNIMYELIPGQMGPLFDVSLNFPVSFILGAFDILEGGIGGAAGSVPALFYSPSTLLCTGALAVFYIGAAGVIFHFRKSETAARPAPGPVLQRIYGGLVAAPTLILLAALAVVWAFSGYSRAMGIVAVILVLLTLVLYGVYTLITTKQFRSLRQGLLVLPLTAAICFVMMFGASAVWRAEMAVVPQASEIAGVRERLSREPAVYGMLRRSEIVMADPELCALVAKNLADVRNPGDDLPGGRTRVEMDIILKNGRVISRRVPIREPDAGRVRDIIDNDADYFAAAGAFPEDREIKSIGLWGADRGGDAFSVRFKTVAREVVQVFREEFQALPPDVRVSLIGMPNYPRPAASMTYTSPLNRPTPDDAGVEEIFGVPLRKTRDGVATLGVTLFVRGVRGGVPFTAEYQLGGHTPRAANLLMASLNEMTDASARTQIAQMQGTPAFSRVHGDLVLENVPYGSDWYRSGSLYYGGGAKDTAESAAWQTLAAWLLSAATDAPDITKPLISYSIVVSASTRLYLYANIEANDAEALVEMAGAALPKVS